jgi:hypothetical protein
MARGDSRRTPKMRRRKSQRALKSRVKRKIEAAKSAKPAGTKPATKKKAPAASAT